MVEGVGDRASVAIAGDDIYGDGSDISVERSAGEGAGGGVEGEPGREAASPGELGGVGEGVSDVHVLEGVGGEGEAER